MHETVETVIRLGTNLLDGAPFDYYVFVDHCYKAPPHFYNAQSTLPA